MSTPTPAPVVSRARMLGRGLAKHCPRCGGGGLFEGWFKMVDRCPRCGHRFEREEGFFLGAYVINLAIAQFLVLLLAVVPFIALLARDPKTGIAPFLAGGLLGAVLGPVAFYPFSKTVWTAFDLILRPAESSEPSDVA